MSKNCKGNCKDTEPEPKKEEVKCGCGDNCDCSLEVEEKLASMTDMYLRARADFENFKRRTQAEVEQAMIKTIFKVASIMLPTYDAIEKAIATTTGDIQKGMEACKKNILDGFAQIGITPIEAKGKDFNPNLHNAIASVKGEENNKVIEEFQKGFAMGDKILRYSMVSVSK